MIDQFLQCCQNTSSLIIHRIQKKKLVSEIDGPGRPHSISEQELVTNG